jgi:hypothetical protein
MGPLHPQGLDLLLDRDVADEPGHDSDSVLA